MSTSILTNGGIVNLGSALYGTDDDPMCTVLMRDGVMHGLLHAADSYGQVRVNYMPIDAGATTDVSNYETIETPANTTDWYLVGGSPFGEWPLTLREDGSGYKLRVRIAGAMSATPATGTFRVVLGPMQAYGDHLIEAAVNSTFEAATTSGTVAWLSGTSQGGSPSATILTVTADQVREWTRAVSIYDAVSSATPHTVQQCLVSAYVFAKTSNTARLPRLYALHLQEYVG